MDDAERMAEIAVEALIEGAMMEWRTHEEQSRQEGPHHDFDLHFPDGSLAAIEATWSRDQALTEVVVALDAPSG